MKNVLFSSEYGFSLCIVIIKQKHFAVHAAF